MAKFDNLGQLKPVVPQMGPKVPNAPVPPTVPDPAAPLQKQVGQIHSATGGAFQPQTGLPPGGGAITPPKPIKPPVGGPGSVQWTPVTHKTVSPLNPPIQPGPAMWSPTQLATALGTGIAGGGPSVAQQPRGGPGTPGYAPPGWVPKTETTAEAFAGTGVEPSTGKAFGNWYDHKSPLRIDPNTGKTLPGGWLWNPTTGKPHQVLISSREQMSGQTPQEAYEGAQEASEGPQEEGATYRDLGHFKDTAMPTWMQEAWAGDQPDWQGGPRDPDTMDRIRFGAADFDVNPMGPGGSGLPLGPREWLTNDSQTPYDPVVPGTPPLTTAPINDPDVLPPTPPVVPPPVDPPPVDPPPVDPPPTDDDGTTTTDGLDDTDGYYDKVKEANDRLNSGQAPETAVIEPLEPPPVPQQQAPQPAQAAPAPLANLSAQGGVPAAPDLTQAPDFTGLGQAPPPPTGPGYTETPAVEPRAPTAKEQAPGSLSTASGKTITDSVNSLRKSPNPLDKALSNTLSGVLEQGADIDVESLMPRLKSEREKLSQIRESAQRRLLSDLARRGFQLGGAQEAAVLAELEQQIATSTAQSFRDIVNDERTRADQRLVQGMQTAAGLVGQREQTAFGQEQLEAQKRIAAGQEALGVGQLGLDRFTQQQQAAAELQKLDLQEKLGLADVAAKQRASDIEQFLGMGALGVEAAKAGTSQYQAETVRMTNENQVMLQNLAQNNQFQMFLMEQGLQAAHWEALLQQAAEGEPSKVLDLLTKYQGTTQAGGPSGFNE